MTDGRRLVLSILNGVLLVSATVAAVWQTTAPTVTVVDTPILTAAGAESAPTTAPVTTLAATPAAPPPTNAAAPVAPPRREYAPEPVLQIGTIEIPKIGLVHPIFHGITMRNIDKGPSHWPGTALPGEVGNAVFAGHRVTKTHPFRNIDKLLPGDEVFFSVDPAAFGGTGPAVRVRYVMSSHEVVGPTALRIVDATPTPTATLFACHPPGSARYRYVVKLTLAPEG
jgi:sortase A